MDPAAPLEVSDTSLSVRRGGRRRLLLSRRRLAVGDRDLRVCDVDVTGPGGKTSYCTRDDIQITSSYHISGEILSLKNGKKDKRPCLNYYFSEYIDDFDVQVAI